MISKYWLLGFVEGDGSFNVSNNTAEFSIKQKDSKILILIGEYLENLPLLPPFPNLFKPSKPHCSIRKSVNKLNSEDAYSLTISATDVLFQYILPFFISLNFNSRKGLDFYNWCLSLYLIVCGYYMLPKGKELLVN
jgi:hypothetical protein